MWVPKKTRPLLKTDAAVIDRDYEDLLYYDFPVLFTGINRLNERVVGSLVENVKSFESYLHSIVDEKLYVRFLRREISYLKLLEDAYLLFLLHWTGEKTPTVYPLNYTDIPEAYKPDAAALCPETTIPPSFDYVATLTGGRADHHQAKPETLSKFQNKVAGLLRTPFDLKPLAKLIADVFLQAPNLAEAHGPGSLKVRYHVELSNPAAPLFHEADAYTYSRFISEYVSYCLNDLPTEAPNLVENRTGDSNAFTSLLNEYLRMTGPVSESPSNRRKELEENLLIAARQMEGITSIVTDEFKDLVISSISESSMARTLGVINEQTEVELTNAIVEVDRRSGKTVFQDTDLNVYKIQIYDLNTNTRKGKGLIPEPTKSGLIMKPTIKILGTQSLPQTKYTESLHLDKAIEVRGRATKVDEVIKHIEIEFEEE
jgi:hypothetical protein